MRILLVAEGATLAHVARPLVLAQEFSRHGHEVHLALPKRYRGLLAGRQHQVEIHDLEAQSPEIFAQRLAAGRPVYDLPTLESYVKDDRKLIAAIKPDRVVGDFRLSLCVSARQAGVFYITLSNAYWSPSYRIDEWPVPDLPLTHVLPLWLARWVFNRMRPLAFVSHARPIERLRTAHGLTSIGGDLRKAYTEADFTCYCDVPSLFPLPGGAREKVVGPLIWSPACELPGWWNDVPSDRPCVYFSMGSSGRSDLVKAATSALVQAGFSVLASAVDPSLISNLEKGVFAATFLPGLLAAHRADVVICNGGSPTTQQAYAAGRPVIGLASNLDQFLNMHALEKASVGVLMRADRFDPRALVMACSRLSGDFSGRKKLRALKNEIGRLHPRAIAEKILEQTGEEGGL